MGDRRRRLQRQKHNQSVTEIKVPGRGAGTVKDRVNAIALAPVEDFRRDSDLFGEGVRSREAGAQINAALRHGLQTRDAELDLGRVLGDLTAR